jgi:transcriptional regulator with XRE-family HTH domain
MTRPNVARTLSRALKERRSRRRLSQGQLANLLGSSQSRVAKMEAGDPSVSLDLLIRSLLALGATHRDLARALGSRRR